MDWVLSCTNPNGFAGVRSTPHRLLNFLQRASGRLDRMLAQTPVVPRARAGRPPPDSYWLDDPAMIEAIARAHVI